MKNTDSTIAINKEQDKRFADAVHDSWARWMTHLFESSHENPDGSVTIPLSLVSRWKRQIETPYALLSENEQQSDQAEVARYLRVLSPEITN